MYRHLIAGVAAATAIFVAAGTVSANTTISSENFDDSASDWTEYGATISYDGSVMIVSGTTPNYGAYSYYGGVASDPTFRQTWATNGFVSELDAFVDPATMVVGDGFDLTVAMSNAAGDHLRDFIFHVGKHADGRVLVNGSNNTDFTVNDYKLVNDGDGTPTEITTAGWYTFQHVIRDDSGHLAVDLNVLDADDTVIFTTTRTNAGDVISNVGGPRYQWLTFVNGTVSFDNQLLEAIVPTPSAKADCKKGGFEAFGFDNQGQCIASLQASERSVHNK